MYGPTEATCGATITELRPNKQITVGPPNPSTRIYILDRQGRLLPRGAVGEVYLAGVQVAAGYVGGPTAERFLADSVNPQYKGECMYKTGDLGYWLEDGDLMLIGRQDRQIKLRGFRIDLDDLEHRIKGAYERCTAAAVALEKDQLVALVQPANLEMQTFRSLIRECIPSYAIPFKMKAVDSFPRTAFGKRDYQTIISRFGSLSGPEPIDSSRYTANSLKPLLTRALREVFSLPDDSVIDDESNLRDLGGDSLTAVSLSHQVADVYYDKKLAPAARQYSQITVLNATPQEVGFWSTYLRGHQCQKPFSIGNSKTPRSSWSGSSYVCQVDEILHENMLRFSYLEKVTMHQLALGAVAVALSYQAGTCDIILGAPFANRRTEEDCNVVGLFLEPLPVRIQYPETIDFTNLLGHASDMFSGGTHRHTRSFISAVRQSSRAALSHAIPWNQLLSHLDTKPSFPDHPIFEAMVTFHEQDTQGQSVFRVPGAEFIPTWSEGAKFKLMAEFTTTSAGTLGLRLEYSDECFEVREVRLLSRLIAEALREITEGKDYPSIIKALRNIK
ncbi:hypothetical protein N0V93_004595 [Gnomoniopsis smithogilvyi]|uniref:Carrier domain-containing protein n=1 Tax=Gnomoniopsis smithogilvyi TaxID=1191159 RepID=A0A9W9CXC6_9PEZI|nr:hypothetical protein N0V93_004595 [Gnomoniopsis smithogilvyi]